MKGLILAAGEGKRIKKLSKNLNLPKALLPVGKQPMIEYVLDNFKKTKIREIALVIPPKTEEKFREDLQERSFKLTYILQEKPEGTGKALELTQNFANEENFLLAYCDSFTLFDFNKLVFEHEKYRPVATLLVNKGDDPRTTGLVEWQGDYITRIVEKPVEKFSEYGSAGVMVLEPNIFGALEKIRPSAENEYHIGDALQYLINAGEKVRYKIIDTWRINLNRPEDILKAEELLERKKI